MLASDDSEAALGSLWGGGGGRGRQKSVWCECVSACVSTCVLTSVYVYGMCRCTSVLSGMYKNYVRVVSRYVLSVC